ncbi:helix-turn-helix transcriptional regulator [Rhizobium sp. CFBP 8762]|uniref:ArsR/SmtB family transcription factor n=1 Tax=Rhizobium sp. CFBP 8762 TaxID=2775279 RepID=UPI0017815A0D|nr:helix-turn-helix domain-containing protein [Rhizobium sp. CFBP 8762]MBD8554959.1 helix-turn-helix transcriptional regulator [Rhizobium sp. CFBP 8762]
MDIDRILKALANPARMEILNWLKDPAVHFSGQHLPLDMGVCAGQFERCGLSQSTVSSHLSVLQQADLIIGQRVGQWIFYRRNEDTILAFLTQLNTMLSAAEPL